MRKTIHSNILWLFLIASIVLAIAISGCCCPNTIAVPSIAPSSTITPSYVATPIIDTATPITSASPPVTSNPTLTATPIPTKVATPTPITIANAESSVLTVHFINVGQGDSELLKIDDKVMLIDGGPTEAGSTVVSYLRSQGVTSIDVLVSTHPHEDHIGGLLAVLNNIPVKKIVDSGQVTTSQTYESYLNLIDQKNIPYTVGERGQTIDLGGNVKIEILSPPSTGLGDDLNMNSLVLKVTHGNVKFLFMGDAGFEAENSMMSAGYDLKSDVLKVGHHGSKYSSGSTFLSRVKPGVSVIEVGAHNSYGHPAPETLTALQAIGTTVYRTDINGNVVVTSDGNKYSVTTQNIQTSTIAPITTPNAQTTGTSSTYIGNSNTKKFHLPSCRYVPSISPEHVVTFTSRDEAISKGYVPCKVCNP